MDRSIGISFCVHSIHAQTVVKQLEHMHLSHTVLYSTSGCQFTVWRRNINGPDLTYQLCFDLGVAIADLKVFTTPGYPPNILDLDSDTLRQQSTLKSVRYNTLTPQSP